jgi:hypothetical protein
MMLAFDDRFGWLGVSLFWAWLLYSGKLTKNFYFWFVLGTDGRGGTRLTCGTTVAEGKDKLARVVKVLTMPLPDCGIQICFCVWSIFPHNVVNWHCYFSLIDSGLAIVICGIELNSLIYSLSRYAVSLDSGWATQFVFFLSSRRKHVFSSSCILTLFPSSLIYRWLWQRGESCQGLWFGCS